MNESTLLMIFIGVSSLAIVIQAVILAGMYAATKKTSAQIEKLAEEVRTKALPAVESVQMMIVDNKGKVEEIIDNLTVVTTTARSQLVRIDATLNDVLDRTRLQVMRADELATSTMDRIEETTEIVQHTIISPVRRINGVLSALSTGMGMFVAGRRAQKASQKAGAGQQEDMFI
jgi:transcriptional regulator with PAS, ATPase and Fis domain